MPDRMIAAYGFEVEHPPDTRLGTPMILIIQIFALLRTRTGGRARAAAEQEGPVAVAAAGNDRRDGNSKGGRNQELVL